MAEEFLSDYEKIFLLHGVQDGLRLDGRSSKDFRPKNVELDIIKNSYGSCFLSLGNTRIIATIKADIDTPDLNYPNEGKIDFFIECSANASPLFQGRNGESFSNEIINELNNLFSRKNFDYKQLCIVENRKCWHLNIDLVLMEYCGNIIDACALAVRYAIRSAKFPKIAVKSDDNGQIELDVEDSNINNHYVKLNFDNLPYFVSVCKIGRGCIVDPDLKEESITQVKIIFGIDQYGNIRYVNKDGFGSLDPETLSTMVDIAKEASKSIHKYFENS